MASNQEIEVNGPGVAGMIRQVDGLLDTLRQEISGHAGLAVPNAFGQLGSSVEAVMQSTKQQLDATLDLLGRTRTEHNRNVQLALEQNYLPTDGTAATSYDTTVVVPVPRIGP